MISGMRRELKIMWANVWFRSLLELVAVAIGLVVFMLVMQATVTGRAVIEQVKQQMQSAGSGQ